MIRYIRVLDGVALAALGLALAASLARPLFYWDSWAYHLPFSALLWDLGGARSSFVLSPEMQVRYDGFPLAAELLQGALWKLTGTINSTALVNSAAFAAFVVVATRALGASVGMLALGALAFPLVALHAVSNYIDLFVGSCVAIQALAAVKIESVVRERPGAPLVRWCWVFVAAAALAGNSKITGLVTSVAIGAFLAAYLAAARRGIDRRRLAAVVVVVAVAAVLAAGTALRNAHRYGNPVYPFDTTVAGIHLSGPEPEYRSYPEYSARLGAAARPLNWLLSITDLDWAIRGSAPPHTLDMAAGADTAEGTPARTGGYGGVLVVGSLALAAWLALRLARSRRGALRERRFLLAIFAFVSLVTAVMPQSHELRYHLHWPLLLIALVAALVRSAALAPRASAAIATTYLAAFLVSQYTLDFPWRAWPPAAQEDFVAGETRAPPLEEVRASRAACLGPEINPRQFAYSAVFHGGDYVVEQGWTRCVRFPQLQTGVSPQP